MTKYTLAYCYNHTNIDIMHFDDGILGVCNNIHSIACNSIPNYRETDVSEEVEPDYMTEKDFQDRFYINKIKMDILDYDNQNQITFIHDSFKASIIFTH